jgi:hypothetical protein
MNGRYSFSLLLLLLQLRKRKRKRRESPDGGREALVATEEAHVSVLCIIIHSLLERRYALLYIIFSSSSPCYSSSLPLGDSLPWPGVRSNQHSSAQLSSAQLSSAQLSSAQLSSVRARAQPLGPVLFPARGRRGEREHGCCECGRHLLLRHSHESSSLERPPSCRLHHRLDSEAARSSPLHASPQRTRRPLSAAERSAPARSRSKSSGSGRRWASPGRNHPARL